MIYILEGEDFRRTQNGDQAIGPPPVKVMSRYIREMLQYGFSAKAIRTMTVKNPGRVLDLLKA